MYVPVLSTFQYHRHAAPRSSLFSFFFFLFFKFFVPPVAYFATAANSFFKINTHELQLLLMINQKHIKLIHIHNNKGQFE